MKNFRKYIKPAYYPVLLILTIAFLIRIISLNYNTPFLDEAIYYKLGQRVLAGTWEDQAPFNWVGGFSFFYPVVSALAGYFNGIIGSRFFNVLLGTFSVYLMYLFGLSLHLSDKKEGNEFIGGISAFILAIAGVPVFLSRIATYDMLTFTLLLSSLAVLHFVLNLKTIKPWYKENLFFLSALFLFLSFLAKYITLIIFPVIVIWALIYSHQKKDGTLKLTLKYFLLPLVIMSLVYIIWNFAGLLSFWQNQVPDPQKQYSEILSDFVRHSLPVSIFSIPGLIILALKKKWVFLYFVFGSLTLPAIHLLTNNLDSVSQHTFIVLIFLIPPLSYSLSLLPKSKPVLKTIISLIILFIIFSYSRVLITDFESSWPNSGNVMAFLRPVATPKDTILTSEGEVTNLALPKIPDENIYSFWDFDYKGESGAEAYKWALRDGYFTYILINKNLDDEMAKLVMDESKLQYEPLYTDESFLVLKSKVPSG